MKHKDKDGKPIPDKGTKAVSLAAIVILLCGFSFYLGGIFCSEKNIIEEQNVQVSKAATTGSPKEPAVAPIKIKAVSFPECSIDYQDYTPCTDPKVLFCDSLNSIIQAQDLKFSF